MDSKSILRACVILRDAVRNDPAVTRFRAGGQRRGRARDHDCRRRRKAKCARYGRGSGGKVSRPGLHATVAQLRGQPAGSPATRAEIIGGLKKQGLLVAQGKHIVPTEAGLSLFGVLKQADPALVDPRVTAQLECLLDDVVLGKQEMVGAIDAVCNVAERIIGKLKEGGTAGGPPLLGAAVGNGHRTFPPTPAMNRFADSLVRQKGIKPPPGYKTSISICRKFLNEHAPKKAEGETAKPDSKPISPAQMLYAKKIAQGKGVVISDEAKANSAAMSAWINSNRSAKRRRRGRKTGYKPAGSVAPRPTAPTKRSRKRKPDASAAPLASAQPNSVTGTPLRIPYGNKEVALKLGARYRSGGWYAPPGVDLSAFGERGWL